MENKTKWRFSQRLPKCAKKTGQSVNLGQYSCLALSGQAESHYAGLLAMYYFHLLLLLCPNYIFLIVTTIWNAFQSPLHPLTLPLPVRQSKHSFV